MLAVRIISTIVTIVLEVAILAGCLAVYPNIMPFKGIATAVILLVIEVIIWKKTKKGNKLTFEGCYEEKSVNTEIL